MFAFQVGRGRGQHAAVMDDAEPDEAGEGDERLLPVLRLQVV